MPCLGPLYSTFKNIRFEISSNQVTGGSQLVAVTAVWSLLSFSARGERLSPAHLTFGLGKGRGGNLLSNCQRYNTIMILDAETFEQDYLEILLLNF